MWQHKTISVILPTLNEKKSIRKVIKQFEKLKLADEIIVVNNNAVKGTSKEVSRTSAREVFEPVRGYGSAIRRGLREAKGYYLVICEPDGTFEARDLYKLLSYSLEFDFVVGTRTTQSLIWEGANMGLFLKWGNYIAGKIVEFLFNTAQLTDAGCTYRLINRQAYRTIEPYIHEEGNSFGLEMIILIILHKIPFIQIPVNYKRRVGVSSVTGSRSKALILGIEMIWITLKYWFVVNK